MFFVKNSGNKSNGILKHYFVIISWILMMYYIYRLSPFDIGYKYVFLSDFGLSNTFTRDEMMKTHCGSLEYAAPELFSTSEKYGPEVDIWAL